MNKYRKQQLQAAALIEQGASAEQIAEVFNWAKSRAAPEQIETGDKRTLTPRRKCSIIKAIRRHVRRWKRKQEGNKMKAFEYLISWDITGGYQCAYALVNAKSEKDAVGLILSRIPYNADAELKNKYPYDSALKDNIKVWYFSQDGKEHKEIY